MCNAELLQMVEYEKSGKRDLGDFAYVSKKLNLETSRDLAEKILQEREEFWDGKEHTRGEVDGGGTSTGVRGMQDAYYQA